MAIIAKNLFIRGSCSINRMSKAWSPSPDSYYGHDPTALPPPTGSKLHRSWLIRTHQSASRWSRMGNLWYFWISPSPCCTFHANESYSVFSRFYFFLRHPNQYPPAHLYKTGKVLTSLNHVLIKLHWNCPKCSAVTSREAPPAGLQLPPTAFLSP